jgi:hypothetical protein
LAVGLAGAFCALYLKRPVANPKPSPDTVPQMMPVSNTETVANHSGTNDARTAYVKEHLATLSKLQSNDDAESLQTILCDLTNSEKTVRLAAIQATIQFGSRDAIPVLNNVAARTADPAEKTKLLDAAEYLALPTLTEIRQQDPHAKVSHVAPAKGSSPASPP